MKVAPLISSVRDAKVFPERFSVGFQTLSVDLLLYNIFRLAHSIPNDKIFVVGAVPGNLGLTGIANDTSVDLSQVC